MHYGKTAGEEPDMTENQTTYASAQWRAGALAPGRTARARGAALAVLCVSALIVNLDNTILNVALPTLVRDLNASAGDLQWIVDAYVMVFAGLLLTAGSAADKIGRRKTFMAGLAVFAAGSAWAAFSGSVGMLIAARAGMGIGGALLIPSTLSIISDMYRDPRERQRAVSLWAGTIGFAVALGPVTGGLLLARFWWGSVFLVNVPIAAAGLIAAAVLVPDSRNADAPAPDIPGAVLSIAGIGFVLWAIIEGPAQGWSSAAVIGAMMAGIVVLGLFAGWERVSRNPMLNLGLFRNRAFGAAIPAVSTVAFGLFGALFVLTQFLQFSLGYSPLQAGIRILPAAAGVVVIAPLSALGVRFLGPKITMGAGLALIAGGLWQASGITVSSGYAVIVPTMVLVGAGAGLALPTASGSVLGAAPRANAGVASATNTTAVQVGGALGVAVVGSLLSTRYQDNISAVLAGQHVPPATLSVIKASLGDALAVAAKLPGATGQLLGHLARGAFASGLDLGTLAACGVAIVGFLIALIWLPRTRPTGTDVPAAALDAASPDAGQRGLLWALSDTPRQVPAGGPTAGQPSGPPAGATTGRHKP
jgi:EmrB/QacA subfamily drug resistance transporter